ncbi:hypothetical protein [Streptomyces sp. NPDC055912]|uniref:hypothetical protein n=1 Tax=Streptomyces sp. NPDC055912 TaxID=3345660 RepID=UPI0035D68075
MPLFLEQPTYGPHGPDGQGWNRLSLNAHFDTRHQCGLLPIGYTGLFESRTGRQGWGGYDRCGKAGACGACPVSALSGEQRPLEGWPAGTPLLLGRVRPWALTPGALLADPAGGRSDVHLMTWQGEDTGVKADWQSVRNDYGARISWTFRDAEGEAFWLVRDNPDAGAAVVRTKQLGATTRHALYGCSGGPRLALLTCHGGCAHEEYHLRHLAADLAGLPGSDAPNASRGLAGGLPEFLPAAPGISFAHEARHVEIRRSASRQYPGSTTRFALDVPDGTATTSVLLAYAVRLVTVG